MDDRLVSIATRVSRPLSLAAVGAIVFLLLFRLVLALDVFAPLAETSTFALLTRVLNLVFVLALVALVLGVAAYVLTESWKRKPQAKPAAGAVVLAGNVYYPGEVKAPGATVTADGVMGNTTSDNNGWFALQVHPRDEYTVRAVLDGWAGKVAVKRKQAEKPVIITLAQVAGAPVTPPPVKTPTAPAPSPVTTAPTSYPSDTAAPSHQEFVALFGALKDNFTLKELYELVQVQMNVNPETISGGTIGEYALELASYAKRHGRFGELRAAVKRARPNLTL